MNSMEESFQSDIIGYLEFVSRVHDDKPDQYAGVLLESLQTTLTYYNNTEEAKRQLHKVLFRAWKGRDLYNVDFDIPSFKRGIQPFEFLYIVMTLNMEQLTLIQLSSIPPESSVLAIQELLSFNKVAGFTNDLLISLFQTMLCIDMKNAYNNAKAFAMEYLSNHGIEQDTLYMIICKLSDLLDYYNRQLAFAKQKLNNSLSDDGVFWKEIDKIIDLITNLVILTCKERTVLIDKKLVHISKKLQIIEQKVQKHIKDKNSLGSFYALVERHSLDKQFTQCNNYQQIQTRTKEDIRNTVIMDWESTTANCTTKQDFHQQAFITICHHLKLNAFPFEPVDIPDILLHQDSDKNTEKEYTDGFERLSQLIVNTRPFSALTESQMWCISVLSNKSGLWKSVLKVIVQFMDLWIGFIQESNTGDLFALLITNQKMLPILYQNVLKHVRHYNKYRKPVIFNMLKSICSLLERCLDLSSIGEIQTLRNQAFFNSYSENDKTLPVLGTVDFWNISFDIEITKIGNQITTIDAIEDSSKMNDVLIRKINLLSLIWPYKVIHELLLLCVYNKNQYKVIVPVLRQLGGLCQLKDKVDSDSLLLLVLNDLLKSRDRMAIEEHMGNITQLIKECCHIEFSYPVIMAPFSLVEFSSKALLDIRDLLQGCILKNLECFYTLTTSSDEDQYSLNMSIFKMSLTLLHSLFYSVKEKGEHWLSLVHYEQKDGLPIILYSQPETIAKYLTDILYLRSGTREKIPRGFRLQDWETALMLVRTLSNIAKYTFQPSNEYTKFIQFLGSLENYDWKIQLLWYDLSSHITELKHPILVPDSVFRLTGEMNHLFMSDHVTGNDPLEGWMNLFDACKLSEALIDRLFTNHEKWMYHLILLWKHPNEDDIIGPCFRQVLHPKYNFSVTSEYPILLFDFLERLSGTFDIQKVIYDYSQNDPEWLKVIKKLSEQGIKQFFQVLYIIRLLKEEAEHCKDKELEMESTYYISSLVKTLQGLTNWGSLYKNNFFKSQPAYRVIKAAILPENTCINSTVPTFESNPLVLEDNINSGTTIATGQSEFATHTYYPLFDNDTVSCRALSMLTVCLLCQVCGQFESIETRDILRRLILQVVEGFIDIESKRYFQSMIKKQPKNRIASWKKAKRPKVAMILRPVLSEDEEKLLMSYLESLNDSEKNGILQALNLTLSPESHKNEHSGSKVLYFV